MKEHIPAIMWSFVTGWEFQGAPSFLHCNVISEGSWHIQIHSNSGGGGIFSEVGMNKERRQGSEWL